MVKKSKSVALDNRDLNPLFSMMKGYGPLMALGIIAVLSVCAAFYIYRSSKSQNKENDEKDEVSKKTRKRSGGDEFESTGALDDEDAKPVESNETTTAVCQDNGLVSVGQHGEELEGSDSSGTCQSSESPPTQHYNIGTDLLTKESGPSSPQPICDGDTDLLQLEDGLADQEEPVELGDVNGLSQCSGTVLQEASTGEKTHTFVDETWEDLTGYFGKACLKVDPSDVQETCTSLPASPMVGECEQGKEAPEVKSSELQGETANMANHGLKDFQVTNQKQLSQERVKEYIVKETTQEDLACQTVCSGDETVAQDHKDVTPLHDYHTDYLSISPHTLSCKIGESMSIKAVCEGSTVAQSQASSDGELVEDTSNKSEISIMEATMDNNEWLNGNEQQNEFPWMSLGQHGDKSSLVVEKVEQTSEEVVRSTSAKECTVPCALSDEDPALKRVATIPPMPLISHVTFSVHYITNSPNQHIAVTGNHPDLGGWLEFVPLQQGKDGFWANTVSMPVASQVEWKFVLVEDGRICRWEECSNRHLAITGQDEIVHVQRWWGFL